VHLRENLLVLATATSFSSALAEELPPPFLLEWALSVGSWQIGVHASGDVCVSDPSDNVIEKFDNDGDLITQWGSQCQLPGFGCVDSDGAGPLEFGDGQFWIPRGVATDASGNTYVVDSTNHRIQKFDSNGSFLLKWGSPGSGDGQFQWPWDIAVDSETNVYVTDILNNQRVTKYDRDGNFLLRWELGGVECGISLGIATDAVNNVYVTNDCNNSVQKFDSRGGFLLAWGSQGSGDGQFEGPRGVALDASGNIYVADFRNHRIQKFDSDGEFLTKWGSRGSGAGQFESPPDVGVDAAGNVYVIDAGNDRIQKFGVPATDVATRVQNGMALSIAPNPPSTTATITYSVAPGARTARLVVYDLRGRVVARILRNGSVPSQGSVVWDGRNANGASVGAGVYIVRLETDRSTVARKVVLIP